jgi:hypothetical protein
MTNRNVNNIVHSAGYAADESLVCSHNLTVSPKPSATLESSNDGGMFCLFVVSK